MTVQTTVNKQNQAGNGIQTVFPFTFQCTDSTWIHAYIDDVEENQGDLAVLLNADQVNNPGGTVEFLVTTPPNPSVVTIERQVPFTQLIDYAAYSAFPAETHESGLDKLTYLIQQVNDLNGRALHYPVSDTTDTELASIAARANTYLGFDVAGGLVYRAATDGDPNAMQLVTPYPAVDTLATYDAAGQVKDSGIPGNIRGRLIDVQIFTSNGTWNKPAGCTAIEVECIGAGGGSGAATSTNTTTPQGASGGPGGGGGYFWGRATASIGASATVVVGAGGTAGSAGVPGGAGGNSTFDDGTNQCQSNGGQGGSSISCTGGSATLEFNGAAGALAGTGFLLGGFAAGSRIVSGMAGKAGGLSYMNVTGPIICGVASIGGAAYGQQPTASNVDGIEAGSSFMSISAVSGRPGCGAAGAMRGQASGSIPASTSNGAAGGDGLVIVRSYG